MDNRNNEGGTLRLPNVKTCTLPPEGQVRRFIITSAQNNTRLHDQTWANLNALVNYYNTEPGGAELIVGTYTYNTVTSIGAYAAKRKTSRESRTGYVEWWDDRLEPFICDEPVDLAKGLRWCGEMQVLPTAEKPLSGLEAYTGRLSSIFPHSKISMKSVPSGSNEDTKLMYTTGTVTQRNYIQKKAGLKAQFHHAYGGLIVEVDHGGHWWVRQLHADSEGTIYDLDLRIENGQVSRDTDAVLAIVWGDIHTAYIDPDVNRMAWGRGGMLDTLRAKHQVFHDILDWRTRNGHSIKGNLHHDQYASFQQGFRSAEQEVDGVAYFLERANRDFCQSVIVNSNHDQMMKEWTRLADYRKDPENAEFFLRLELFMHEQIRKEPHLEPKLLKWAVGEAIARRVGRQHGLIARAIVEGAGGMKSTATFLREDESFIVAPDANGGIELGMHGHRGPNGARGSLFNIAKMGRKSVIGHSHSAGIHEGCYQVGLSGKMDQGYNAGPSSWSHTHCVIYKNGKRTLVTMYAGKWRA